MFQGNFLESLSKSQYLDEENLLIGKSSTKKKFSNVLEEKNVMSLEKIFEDFKY